MSGGGKKNKSNEEGNAQEMGKKVKPAWEEDNPLRKRSCTDLPCLLIFLAFIGGMVRKLSTQTFTLADLGRGGGANNRLQVGASSPLGLAPIILGNLDS